MLKLMLSNLKKIKLILLYIFIPFLLIQLIPIDRENPPIDISNTLDAPSEVMTVLKNSCYDCHSNETNWPFYSYIAPISWLVYRDVKFGREDLNFSEWNNLTDESLVGEIQRLNLLDKENREQAKELIKKAAEKGVNLLLPQDHIVAAEFSPTADHMVCSDANFPADWMALDIGPATIATYTGALRNARMVVWNGPMGVFEFDNFAKGTMAVAETLADSKARSIVGGGDSVAAVTQVGLSDAVSYVSTGGGAMLELLEGKELPGVAALLAD